MPTNILAVIRAILASRGVPGMATRYSAAPMGVNSRVPMRERGRKSWATFRPPATNRAELGGRLRQEVATDASAEGESRF